MKTTDATKWISGIALASLVLLAGSASPAHAQRFFPNPQAAYYNAALNQAYLYGTSYGGVAAVNQAYLYGGYGAGYDPYYGNPYGGYLMGAANVIDAEGRFLVNQQQAYLGLEQVRAERIANQRRRFDESLYERTHMISGEQLREEQRELRSQRARTNPPVTEIYSGQSLNDLLVDLQIRQGRGALSEAPPGLTTSDVQQINFTSKRGSANIGLLKKAGQLTWPTALTGADYQDERQQLSVLAQKAVKQAESKGWVDNGILQQISDNVQQLHQQLRDNVKDVPPDQYIEAKRFLNQFDDAGKALQQADVGNYFNGKYTFQGLTVADLVRFMTERGLSFAPAVAGDEAAYRAVHQALAAYDTAVHATALEARVARR
jgi:hypothetical protein